MSKEESVHEKHGRDSESTEEIDFTAYYEDHMGRLIVDPQEAKIEFGEANASRLRLTDDGTKILWPQPTESARDPQNWSMRKKDLQLVVITLAAIVPDFDGGIGVACLFNLAAQFNATPNHINNLTANWSIFLSGWAGIIAVVIIRRYGRLPVLFWSQVLALGFIIGCTFSPNLKTYAAMRCLTAFFSVAPQITGVYVVADMYPFHLEARKLSIWAAGFLLSPFISPFFLGFLAARASWRWAYGIGSLYGLFVVCVVAFFGEETMYDRTVRPIPEPTTTGLRYRIETLVGITGWKMSKYRASWKEAVLAPLSVIWRPHLLLVLVFEAMLFGFSVGLNITNVVFLGIPVAEGGYGFSQIAVAGSYGTPIVAVVLGEIAGRYLNDWVMTVSVRRNKGVFVAETRLWTCYLAVILNTVGFVILGAAIQHRLNIGALIIGWGIAEIAAVIGTVSAIAYCNDCFPKHRGEVSALGYLARVLGGFSIAYYQVPWALKHGAIQTFGCEAAIVVGLFVLAVPLLQWKGPELRKRYSMR